MVPVPEALQILVLVLAALLATAVALTQDTRRQVLLNGVYGLALVLVFAVLQAPDVALSMLVVSCIAIPLVALATIGRIERDRDKED